MGVNGAVVKRRCQEYSRNTDGFQLNQFLRFGYPPADQQVQIREAFMGFSHECGIHPLPAPYSMQVQQNYFLPSGTLQLAFNASMGVMSASK